MAFESVCERDHIKVKFILLVGETKVIYFHQFVSLLLVYINMIPVTGIISRLFWIENEISKNLDSFQVSKYQLKSSEGFSHHVNVLLYDL